MTQPEPPLRLFVDRSLGRRKVVEALQAEGHDVIALDEVLAQDCPDTVWLGIAGAEKRTVLTKDKNILHNLGELQALYEAGVHAVVLASGDMTGDQVAATFVKAIPKIRALVAGSDAPCVARLHRSGKLEMAFDKDGLTSRITKKASRPA